MKAELTELFAQVTALMDQKDLDPSEKIEAIEAMRDFYKTQVSGRDVIGLLSQSSGDFFEAEPDPEEEKEKALILSQFFHFLKDNERQGLADIAEYWPAEAGEEIFKTGESLEGIYLLLGTTEIVSLNGGRIKRHNQALGFDSLLTDTKSAYTLVATEDTKVLLLPKEDLAPIFKLVPDLMAVIGQYFWSRQIQMMEEELTVKAKIEDRAKQVLRIMNNIGQAIFTIDSRGEIGEFYSTLAGTYLGYESLEGRPFADIILRENPKGLKSYYRALSLLFSGNQFDPDVVIDLLPSAIEMEGRHLRLSYSFLEDSQGFVIAITVRIKDISRELFAQKEEEDAQAKSRQEQQIQEKIKENIVSYLGLIDLIDKNAEQLQILNKNFVKPGVDASSAAYADLMVSLHTIKGFSGQFDLSELKTEVHQMESIIQEMAKTGVESQKEAFTAKLKSLKKK